MTISSDSEILASTCAFHDDIVQIFEFKNGVISVKGSIKNKFKIVVLTSFEGQIIALINEEDHRENVESFTVKLFDRAGKVYWSTPLAENTTANLLSRMFCVQENGELFCILRNDGDASMAKLNAHTGELICEPSENVNADSHETCDIFYCSLETDADYVDIRSSDFKHKRILAFGEAGRGYWPHLVQYDKERNRFLVAYDSYDTYTRKDRIDILKISGAETRIRDSYRFIGKLSNVKQHVIDAVNRVFS